MTAFKILPPPITISGVILEDLLLSLEDSTARLCGAHAAYLEAADTVANHKHQLETERATLLAEGVEGKNEAQRESVLRLQLQAFYDSLRDAEKAVAAAKVELECASLEHSLNRAKLRVYEISTSITGAAD